MGYRMLEVSAIWAEDLKDVKLFGKMQTYVVAWVDPSRKASTNLDKHNGKNPKWDDKLLITVTDQMLQQPNSMLVMEIYNRGSMGNTIVGRVNIPLKEISDKNSGSAPFSYKVWRPSGRSQGVLHLSLKLGEKTTATASSSAAAAAYGYPAQPAYPPAQPAYPPAQHGYPPAQQGYPPAQQGYAYAYPAGQQGQGYYPPAGGGMYPPVVAPQAAVSQTRPGRFGGGGAGLGLGLAGGLLGGLLIGDMIDDFGGGDW